MVGRALIATLGLAGALVGGLACGSVSESAADARTDARIDAPDGADLDAPATDRPADAAADGAAPGDAQADAGSDTRPPLCTAMWQAGGAGCEGRLPRSCHELFEAGVIADGPYRIDPAEGRSIYQPFVTYCDMQPGVGGWTLIAKIHIADVDSLPESRNWFAVDGHAEALIDTAFVKNQPPASHGPQKIAPLLREGSLTRFDVHAGDDVSVSGSFYKVVASQASMLAWFQNDATPSRVCTNVEMTTNCSEGTIASSGGATLMAGMNLAAYGHASQGVVHMRLDGDQSPAYSGICSNTFQSTTWPDSYQTHWGNGLLIFLKE